MQTPFDLYVPQNLTFQDYLEVIQTARTWADGYDLKSYSHLISTLAPNITIDYTGVNPTWGSKLYDKETFAKLWLSEEHLGNPVLNTQHLLGLPYFKYVGPRRSQNNGNQNEINDNGRHDAIHSREVEEIELSWQVLASHARRENLVSTENGKHPQIGDSSDHRAIITQLYVKIDAEKARSKSTSPWKLSLVRPQPIYMMGDFERTRRPPGAP